MGEKRIVEEIEEPEEKRKRPVVWFVLALLFGGGMLIGDVQTCAECDARFVNVDGDNMTGELIVNTTVVARASSYGRAFSVINSGDPGDRNFTSDGGTADMNATTAIICDTIDPFEDGHEQMFLTVISSSPVDYAGATGEIKEVINSSCIFINVAAAGLRSISDSTTMTYYVYKHPLFAVLDRGFVTAHIGKNADAKFEVHIGDGRGVHGFYIDDTVGVDHHQAFTVDIDGANYDGVVGINSNLFSSVAVANKSAVNLLLEIDSTNVSDSYAAFIDIRLIGDASSSDVDAIRIDPNVEHIIHMGDAATIDAAWYNNTTSTTNETANFTSESVNVPIFEEDNSYIYIGDTTNFTTISMSLDTESSQDILAEYYYCNSSFEWETLVGVIDTTAGFRTSGTITFTNPDNRGTCNIEHSGAAFADVTNYTYIAIKRTRGFIVTSPIENLFGITDGVSAFLLQKDMMKIDPVSAPPETCDASMEGAIYADEDLNLPCFCTGTGWVQMDDFSTACS